MTRLQVLLLTLAVALSLAACGTQPAAVATPAPTAVATPAPAAPAAEAVTTPEAVAEEVVTALVAGDTVALHRLVSDEMAMRDIEIPDMVGQWQRATVRNGICGGPVSEVKAVETTRRGESLVVRVLTRCTADGPSSLGRGGLDLTMTPAPGGFQVLSWAMVDGIVIRDHYADF